MYKKEEKNGKKRFHLFNNCTNDKTIIPNAIHRTRGKQCQTGWSLTEYTLSLYVL